MFPAGDHKWLEVAITRKVLRIASGAGREVLRDFTLSVSAGDICALVGPSGCGKTTLLRMIAGLDRDFEGKITWPLRHRIGMVFQEPRLLPWRTVSQNLSIAAPLATRGELDQIVAALGLSEHIEHFPGELSLGLARRVALARAFAIKPDLLLLDEPFVSLDAALAARLREELVALVEQSGVTTLIVTHDIEEAIGLADRIVLLSAPPARIVGDVRIEKPRRFMTPDQAALIKAEIESLIAKTSS
jgi:NitT/TauT family transport system ATP-binding protein